MSMNSSERRIASPGTSHTGPTATLLLDNREQGLSGEDRDRLHGQLDFIVDIPENGGSSSKSETGSNVAEKVKGKKVVHEIPDSATKDADLLAIFGQDFFRNVVFRVPGPGERPWDAPDGFMCLYECYFDNIGLWFPLPKLLTDLCARRQLAISQLTHAAIRHVVGMLTIATEIGIEVDCQFFDEMCRFSPNSSIKDTFYARARTGLSYVEAQRSNIHFWWRRYFFVEVSPRTVEDTNFIPRTTWNPTPRRALLLRAPPEDYATRRDKIIAAAIIKNPVRYERRVLAAVARMGLGRGRAPVLGKFKPSKKATKRPSKRARPAISQGERQILVKSVHGGKGIMTQGGPLRIMSRDAPSSPSDSVTRKRARHSDGWRGKDVAEDETCPSQDSSEGERRPFEVDFRYPGGGMLCCDGDACARLASQLVMTEYPFPPVERLVFKDDYEIMLKSVFRGLGRTNFLVSNYEEIVKDLSKQNAVLKDEKVELEKDVAQLREAHADAIAALEVSEEKRSVLNHMCGYHPDDVLSGDESLAGWKSRGALTAELEAGRKELEASREKIRRYQDFEAVVASYLADRDMAVDAVSLLSEKLGAWRTVTALKIDGELALPERCEAARADFEEQRAFTEKLEVAALDVEDLVSDKARDYVLRRRAAQEKIRDDIAAGSGEEQPSRTDAIDLGGEQPVGHTVDVNPDGEGHVPETGVE